MQDQNANTTVEEIELSQDDGDQEQSAENVVLITSHEEMVSFWNWLRDQEVN